jgi:hypothetical protein
MSQSCEINIYQRSQKERTKYVAQYCEFSPVGWVRIEGQSYPLGFKVVTPDLKSLGLRKNPNIFKFSLNMWTDVLPENIQPGKSDWGGIWAAHDIGGAHTIDKHCLETHNFKARIFLAALKQPLFANSYRIKSVGIMLLREVI